MLIAASLIFGIFTELWPIPLLAGLVGEVAYYASSSTYRWQLRSAPGAWRTAIVSAVMLSAICEVAFWAGSGLRQIAERLY
ncbi:hypothetical protein [Mangrovicella endophytica]|uniref:hypothetical protein n=1 Tax=Mangrovicella endophytica TaxID=2066697 RepID=UPI000C9DB742|nr:hypothetical protein [Mangrovicella endophytica]